MSRSLSYVLFVLLSYVSATVAQAQEMKSDLAAAVNSVVAQPPVVKETAESWKVRLTSTYVSKDVRYFGGLLRDEPAVQTELLVSEPSGWHVGIWWSTGLQESGGVKTSSDEVDFTVGHTWKFERSWWVTADLLYLDLLPESQSRGDILIPRLKFGKDFDFGSAGKLKPYAQVECRLGLLPELGRRPTATLGADYSVKVVGPVSLKVGVSALYDCGIAKVVDTGWTLTGRIGLECKISDGVSAEVFVKEFGPYQERDRQHQEVFGVAVTLSF